MILLDPDIDPDPAASGTAVRRASAPSDQRSRTGVPSERSLARFVAAAQKMVKLRGQVNVLLTTDAEIRRLNRTFRGKDEATDVLSFPAAPQASGQIAGDLAIGIPTARRQGTAFGHSLATELKVLILHGLLHLAGYDHECDNGRMAGREQVLRAKLGLPLGLIERATPDRAPGLSQSRRGNRRKTQASRAATIRGSRA